VTEIYIGNLWGSILRCKLKVIFQRATFNNEILTHKTIFWPLNT
jgi:hypothetical protein